MYIVLVNSEKGGVGKSVISHSIAHGYSMLNKDHECAIAHTDKRDPIIVDDIHRSYEVIDIRDYTKGYKFLTNARNNSELDGLLIVDMGANMEDYAEVLAGHTDLVIIPIECEYDSIRLGKSAKARFADNDAKYLVNKCPPKNSFEYKPFASELYANINSDDVLATIPSIRALQKLSSPEPLTDYVRTKINYHCMDLARKIIRQIEQNKEKANVL